MDNDFLSETEERIEELSQGLLRYEKAFKARTKIDPEILNGIFRAAHTLKGLGGVFGYQEISQLAHAMENLLSKMRMGQILVDHNMLDILFKAIEKLEEILRAESPGSIKIEHIVQKLNQVAEGNAVDAQAAVLEDINIVPENIRKALTEYEEHRLRENLRPENLSLLIISTAFNLDNFDIGFKKLTEWLKRQGEVIATLPVGEQNNPQKIHFQFLYATAANVDTLSQYLEKYHVKVKVLKPKSG
jgi:two-component system chemotaxis sensor kinase CheA